MSILIFPIFYVQWWMLCTIIPCHTLANTGIFAHKVEGYVHKIYDKNGVLQNLWGFIDGTLRKTARQVYFQGHALFRA